MDTLGENIRKSRLVHRSDFRRGPIRLLRLSDCLVERSISEISKDDQLVEVYSHVEKKMPFIINDGSGHAVVVSACSFQEGDLIKVIGRITIKEGSTIPEIDPLIIKEVGLLDLSLYGELKDVKGHIIIERGDEK